MLKKWHKLSQALVALILLIGMIGSAAAPATPRLARLHLLVAQLAAETPEQIIAVIVQKTEASGAAEKLVAQLGGTVTKDLRLINAFVAEMKAKDAPQLARADGVRWVSLDAPMVKSGGPDGTVETSTLLNVYNEAIGADKLWAEGYQGSSITVAVVDSGIRDLNDFKAEYDGNGDLRILTTATIVGGSDIHKDFYGHGTHVAGIIGGNGTLSYGRYIGVAPRVRLVAIDVTNEQGGGTMSDVIAGLQWICDNKAAYNIRVVNISLNSSLAESYHTSALDAAVEILWFNGIVVVVSAGNNGAGADDGILYPPANDPFVITVGAVADQGTAKISDDELARFSAYGVTESGFAKPDLVAPGKNIVSTLSKADNTLAVAHPSHTLSDPDFWDYYFRMSGTSMAAPMVSGAVALLLQDEPDLNPDQVKYRLMATARTKWKAYDPAKAGAGYLDAYAAVHGNTIEAANTGTTVSYLLTTGPDGVLGSSVSWSSVSWSSVSWSSVSWSSVSWSSDYWGE